MGHRPCPRSWAALRPREPEEPTGRPGSSNAPGPPPWSHRSHSTTGAECPQDGLTIKATAPVPPGGCCPRLWLSSRSPVPLAWAACPHALHTDPNLGSWPSPPQAGDVGALWGARHSQGLPTASVGDTLPHLVGRWLPPSWGRQAVPGGQQGTRRTRQCYPTPQGGLSELRWPPVPTPDPC